MSDADDITAPEADPDTAVDIETYAEQIAVEHLAALREMRELGLQLARVMARKAVARIEAAPDADDPAQVTSAPARAEPDPGLSFSRIIRAVRQCMTHEARTLATERARCAGILQAQAPQADPYGEESLQRVRDRLGRLLDQAQARADRTELIRQGVEGVIRLQVPQSDRAFELAGDLRERLIDIEDWDRQPYQPIETLVAGLARDLGLDPQGPRRRLAEDAPPPRRPFNHGPELARAGAPGLKALCEECAPSG